MSGTDMHKAMDNVLNQPAALCADCGLVACRPGAVICIDCCQGHNWLSMPDHRVCGDCGEVQPNPPILRAVRP